MLDWIFASVTWSSENLWSIISVALMIGGFGLIVWPASPKADESDLETEAEKLSSHVSRTINYLEPPFDDYETAGEVRALRAEFESAGVQFPAYKDGSSGPEYFARLQGFLKAILPLIRNNRMDEAKKLAQHLVDE